ncbi:hypothetical protein JCM8115_005046 [Rhodotorula mucilaginosa]|uniref:LIM zinc-binding domain-containing protein n=1 Tax=Rhodotorula mucilaginosa TaxID=5537 RepID=A0A9P6WA53_RHOMI|nr:hypothetical protein C6P46_000112 [Rhodotorula mucilaginosa]
MASQYVQPQPNIGGPRMPYMSNAAAWDRPPPHSLHSPSSRPSPPRRYLPPSQALRNYSPPGAQAYYESSAPADAWTAGRPRNADQPHSQQSNTNLAPPPPTATAQQQWIKCSSCSEMVELEELGDHVCQPGGTLRSLKVDVDGGERSARLRVTNPDRDYDNSENNAAPRSPALSMPRSPVSPSPNSATSTSRLPFFERYQKMVDTSGSNNEAAAAAGQVGSAIPRSPRLALANLSQPSYSAERSPRLAAPDHNATMSTSRSEPLLSPPAPSYPVRKNSLPRPRSPHGEAYQPFSDSPQAQEDRDQDHSHQPAPSQSPSRRELVESTYLAYAAFDDDDDNEDSSPYLHSPHQHHTLTASYSSPADLAGLTVPSTPASYTSRPRDDPASPSGLDACLADLQLLAEDDAVVDEGAAGLMIRGFGDTQDAHSPILGTEQQPPQPLTARSPTPRSRRLPTRQDSFEIRQVPSHLAHQDSITCAVCRAPLATADDLRRAGDGQAFCRPCYADRFLPKCRKCCKPIEGGAVTSSDGKVTGKYHADCFGCFGCSAKFPDGEFYVFDGKPYCQNDYHALNGSLCAAADCGRPIEGSCVSLIGEENGGGGRYHPTCFNCSEPSCRRPLLDFHYIVGGRPFCDEHFSGAQRFCPPWDASVSAARSQAERSRKRQTIVTWR